MTACGTQELGVGEIAAERGRRTTFGQEVTQGDRLLLGGDELDEGGGVQVEHRGAYLQLSSARRPAFSALPLAVARELQRAAPRHPTARSEPAVLGPSACVRDPLRRAGPTSCHWRGRSAPPTPLVRSPRSPPPPAHGRYGRWRSASAPSGRSSSCATW